MRLRRVPEVGDEPMGGQEALDGCALHALATPMDETHELQARLVRRVQIILDNGDDIARLKRVQIDRVFDWDPNVALVFHCVHSCRELGSWGAKELV